MKVFILSIWFFLFVGLPSSIADNGSNGPMYPVDVQVSDDGDILVAEKRDRRVAVYSQDGKNMKYSFSFNAPPTGMALDGADLFVTTFGEKGELHILKNEEGAVAGHVEVRSGACSPVFDRSRNYLYVCNQFQNSVSVVDVASQKVITEIAVLREPKSAVLSKDAGFLFVTNYLPAQRADLDHVAACVSVIDLHTMKKVKDIRLANGSNALRGICITDDGRFVYVSHNLGRYTVPTSQLQQGWMNTSAFSVIDVEKQEFLGTVIVDEPERGAAGIWSVKCNADKIFISHSGTHEISIIDHKKLLDKFLAYKNKSLLEYDLLFLFGMRKRIPLGGNGPRNMCLHGDKLYVPTYFADILNVVDVSEERIVDTVNMNPGRMENDAQKGERYFNDALHCFQTWQSCNGCHPGDGRTDGMNWDLMNDGVGNSKNCKSLLFSIATPPSMISGIRESAELAIRTGFRFIQFFQVTEEDALCVEEYVKSLKPVPSPYLENGELSKKAEEGKVVFEKLKCGECHSGIYFTDMKMHRIGDSVEFEKGWDTPTLREVWRTAPYLFDGRAATMKDVFMKYRHGIDRKKISEEDVDRLVEYVNSL